MRVTNNMIMNTTKSNINRNKVQVDKKNTQMSSQKKIDVPSDDPVIAVRALRLRSTLNQIDQYLNTNVKDAEAWLDLTQSSLSSLEDTVEKIHTQCVNGSTGHLTQDDRNTILTNLQQLRDQIYYEGNNDYAGRTIFTGYKTNSSLTFLSDSTDSYTITEPLSYENVEEKNYYAFTFDSFAELPGVDPQKDVAEVTMQRIRLSYTDLDDLQGLEFSYGEGADKINVSFSMMTTTGPAMHAGSTTVTDSTGAVITGNQAANFYLYTLTSEEVESWYAQSQTTGEVSCIKPDEIILNKDTGELLLGKNVAAYLKSNKADITATYDKTGFAEGELRPEHYFNCVKTTDPTNPVEYVNYDKDGNRMYEDINYYVGNNQTITVNTLAADTFNSAIGRDVDELSDAVQFAINAYDTVEKIKTMQTSEQYSSDADQERLELWLEAAQRQLDYADANMEKLYTQKLTTFDNYETAINLALTTVGSKGQRLDLIKNRLESEMMTVQELKDANENMELSDVIIDYTAAYNAYTASLQAAAKVEEQTLLDYL